MVQVTVGGRGQLQSTEADVVQSLIVDTVGLVCVFNQLMYGQCCIVWFYHCIRNLQILHTYNFTCGSLQMYQEFLLSMIYQRM